MPYKKLADTDEHAAIRAERYLEKDPYPEIPAALLSSAEIHRYARETGMLHPFYPDKLKSASYPAHMSGCFIHWDPNGKRIEKKIEPGSICILPANSISFVQIEPHFRLPNYIALRFNLRITHVHRGLLLGTGPLVDPGFQGKLLVPLHNLTSSAYPIDTTKALIWIEFTKTTYNPQSDSKDSNINFVGFNSEKNELTPDDYLRKANQGQPIRSSIPDALENARQRVIQAEKAVKGVRNISIAGGFVGAIALVGLVFALFQVFGQVKTAVQQSGALATSVTDQISDLVRDAERDKEAISKLRSVTDSQLSDIRKLRSQIGSIQKTRAKIDSNVSSEIESLKESLENLKPKGAVQQ